MFPKDKRKQPLSDIKEWFVIIENQQEGPLSLLDLKRERRFTPDTLVWKKGFPEWTRARFIPEMKELFKDDPEPQALHEPNKEGINNELGQENQVTLTLQQDPYQLLLWILLFLLIAFYTFYRFFYDRF